MRCWGFRKIGVASVSDKEKKAQEEAEDMVVVMTDEEGNEYYYEEEMIIPVGEDRFALLVGIPQEGEEHTHSCGCGHDHDEEEEDVIIAKIVVNADGEEEYVEPTDEEFEQVQKAYDALLAEEEDAQE